MGKRILFTSLIVADLYLAVIGCFWWVYKRNGMGVTGGLLYSFDTIACRGRMPEPTMSDLMSSVIVQWSAAAQSLFGHLGLPILMAVLFSTWWLERKATPSQ